MSTSLISSIMQFITPAIVGKIASGLGIDRGTAEQAVSAGVPALLAAITGAASKPGGTQQLSNALAQQPPHALENVKSAVGGSEQKAVADSGSSVLSSLLGGQTLGALTTAISNFTGINPNTCKSLVGLLSPMVLGVLGHQQRSAGLDANGLASLLHSQKSQIAQAMPAGFVNHLSGTGLLDELGKGLRGSAAATKAAASTARGVSDEAVAHATQAAYATKGAASSMQWPAWVIGLVALGGLLWYLYGGQGAKQFVEQAEERIATQSSATTDQQPSPSTGVADLSSELNSSVKSVQTTLQGITDPASAQAAVPKLNQAVAQLDEIGKVTGQLPPEEKRMITSLVAAAAPEVNQLCDKVEEMPGVGSIAKPAIDALRARLNTLANA